jgi:2-keto-3-deoxy-L-rhamnonate aldolase RhmA
MEKFGGLSQTEYLQQANDSLITIVQIETKEALEGVGIQCNRSVGVRMLIHSDRRSIP